MTNSDTGRTSRRSRKNNRTVREECTKTLAAHINNQPGLSIELNQVSLHDTERFGYFWTFQNKFIARYFSKRLSSLSMAACRQLSQEVGHTFKAMPTSMAMQVPNCNYENFQLATMAPIAPVLDCGTTHTQIEGSSHSTGAFNDCLLNGEEATNLRIELQNLSAQHECAIQQLQDCRTQFQAAIERNERYESFIVNAFLRMDDMETMIGSLRDGWYKALGGYTEGYSIDNSQNQSD